MPLSEHEQRMLEEMEQALYAEDPKFATHLVGPDEQTSNRRRIVLGVIGAIVGLGLVVVGVTADMIWLGGIGFALMVAGGGYAATPGRSTRIGVVDESGHVRRGPKSTKPSGQGGSAPRRAGGGTKRKGGGSGGFMSRMEERWDRRRDGGDGGSWR